MAEAGEGALQGCQRVHDLKHEAFENVFRVLFGDQVRGQVVVKQFHEAHIVKLFLEWAQLLESLLEQAAELGRKVHAIFLAIYHHEMWRHTVEKLGRHPGKGVADLNGVAPFGSHGPLEIAGFEFFGNVAQRGVPVITDLHDQPGRLAGGHHAENVAVLTRTQGF